jgi:hypothetical protein
MNPSPTPTLRADLDAITVPHWLGRKFAATFPVAAVS